MTARRVALAAAAATGWFALVLQFVLLIRTGGEMGLSLAERLARFFSYFTIQTNILAALGLTAHALGWRNWLASPKFAAAVAASIAMVGIVYALVLARLWAPQGAQYLADLLLHTVMPLAYLAIWLVLLPRDGLGWRDPLVWLAYPLVYCAAVVTRGLGSGFYPYPFIDADKLAPPLLALNIAVLTVAFLAVALAAVAAGRWLPRREI